MALGMTLANVTSLGRFCPEASEVYEAVVLRRTMSVT